MVTDRARRSEVHGRWLRKLNRDQNAPGYKDEWRVQQCLHCTFYAPLDGELGYDYGACTHSQSPFDKTVMYEHDGCDHHVHEEDN
jgi:hypothetical protein